MYRVFNIGGDKIKRFFKAHPDCARRNNMPAENEERKEDLGEGYVVIETKEYYSILTPTASQVWPKAKFRSLISRFAHGALREPEKR